MDRTPGRGGMQRPEPGGPPLCCTRQADVTMQIVRRAHEMRITRMIAVLLVLATAGRAEIANIVVTSAASFEKGRPAGGSIASVFCTGLKGISGVISADRYPLPLERWGSGRHEDEVEELLVHQRCRLLA